ncbi:MAG: hypothetical protein HY719_02935 [Planctomycetes bacterium]|nr:hypothetical protein [Planctomycetota bacterium]
MDIPTLHKALAKQAGDQFPRQKRSPIEQAIFTVLAEGDSSRRALAFMHQAMKVFVDWNELRVSLTQEVQALMEAQGIGDARARAVRLKKLLTAIIDEYNVLSLDHLLALKPGETKRAFTKLEKLAGPLVVESVAQYALEHPAFAPLDNVARVLRRLEVAGERVTDHQLGVFLSKHFDSREAINAFCELVADHGDRVCHAAEPECASCEFQSRCPGAKKIREERERRKEKEKEAAARKAAAKVGAKKKG